MSAPTFHKCFKGSQGEMEELSKRMIKRGDMRKSIKELIEEILKNNPQIDPEKIAQEHAAAEQRRALSRHRRGYRLILPMFRKRAHAADDDTHDPRTLQLRQH